MTAVLVGGGAHPGARPSSPWRRRRGCKGLAEAASELRRHLLDRLRDGDLDRGEELLGVMDDVYDALVVIDYPDAITGGLRRTLDALAGRARAHPRRRHHDGAADPAPARHRTAIESPPDSRFEGSFSPSGAHAGAPSGRTRHGPIPSTGPAERARRSALGHPSVARRTRAAWQQLGSLYGLECREGTER